MKNYLLIKNSTAKKEIFIKNLISTLNSKENFETYVFKSSEFSKNNNSERIIYIEPKELSKILKKLEDELFKRLMLISKHKYKDFRSCKRNGKYLKQIFIVIDNFKEIDFNNYQLIKLARIAMLSRLSGINLVITAHIKSFIPVNLKNELEIVNITKDFNFKDLILTGKESEKEKTSRKKLILFDFDGLVHQHSTNDWKGIDVITGGVVPGMKELIEELRKKYQIYIYSSRCLEQRGSNAIGKWLKEKEIEVDGITSKKLPYASILVDDRAVGFNGDVDKLKNDIENFKVWTEK